MSYQKRLDKAFINAPVLPITPHTHYVFFSDCHRGVRNNNDDFLKKQRYLLFRPTILFSVWIQLY